MRKKNYLIVVLFVLVLIGIVVGFLFVSNKPLTIDSQVHEYLKHEKIVKSKINSLPDYKKQQFNLQKSVSVEKNDIEDMVYLELDSHRKIKKLKRNKIEKADCVLIDYAIYEKEILVDDGEKK